MAWKVFFIPRWQKSVLGVVRNLTLNAQTFSFDGTPTIPPLTYKPDSQTYTGSDDSNYSYTLKTYPTQPPSSEPYFLGHLKKEKTGTDPWYDTILAINTSNVLDPISNFQGTIQVYVPAEKWLKNNHTGSLSTSTSTITIKKADNAQVSFPCTRNTNLYPHSMWHAGHTVDGVVRRFGAIYVNQISLAEGTKDVLFGHFHWDTDLYGPGDCTEPFVALHTPGDLNEIT